MYDAIVIGARAAGSPAAMLLARKGYKVLMVDKASFPSDTLSTHYIHQTGSAVLKSWGLLDRVAATGCPPLTETTVDFGPVVLRGLPPEVDGVAEGYAPRRTVLDKLLVDAAVEAGAELREHFTVDALTASDSRITGLRGHQRGGESIAEQARIVIGADGHHSLVAKKVEALEYEQSPAHSCAYYTYFSDAPTDLIELYARPERMIIGAMTNDGATLAIVYWPEADFHAVRSDIEGSFWAALDTTPLGARLREGKRVERFTGTVDLGGFYRKPYGPGWALIGDAGYHKNPITAQGISDAFRDAELLASAIDDGFSGRRQFEVAMADYEQRRNESTMPMYQMTCDMARLQPPPPEQQALIAALAGNPHATRQFLGTVTGATSIPDFFSPQNLAAIMGMPPVT